MAVAIANLSGQHAASATALTTPSLSPAAGSVLLIACHAYISSGGVNPAQPTITTTTGGTATFRGSAATDDAGGTDRATVFLFTMVGAGAGTITVTWSGAMTGSSLVVDEATGADTTTPLAQGIAATGATATSLNKTLALGAAATAGNAVYGVFAHTANEGVTPLASGTPNAAGTELADQFAAASEFGPVETQVRTDGGNSLAGSWVTSARNGVLVAEIAAASTGTTYQLSGTVAGTSAASLTFNLPQVSGTVAAVSGVASPSLSVAAALGGAVAGTSGVSASAGLAARIAGAAAAVSGVSGAPIGVLLIGGSVAGTSGTSLTFLLPQMSGTVAGTSGTVGSAGLMAVIVGTVAGTSGATGAIVVTGSGPAVYQLAGAIAAVSGASASAGLKAQIAGSVAGTSATSGAPYGVLVISGAVGGTSTAAGSPIGVLNVSGTTAGTSTAAGGVALRAQVAGSVAGTSGSAGTAGLKAQVAGTVVALTTVSGAPRGVLLLSGRVDAVTGTVAGVNVIGRVLWRVVTIAPGPEHVITPVERSVSVLPVAQRTITVFPEEAPVRFPVSGRRYYRLNISATGDSITAWSASFDGGATWVAGTSEGNNVFSWLLDTPSTIGGHNVAATQVNANAGTLTKVKLRADDSPELLILSVPDSCNVEWIA